MQVFIAEEQQLLLAAYQAMADRSAILEVVGASFETGAEEVIRETALLLPDVLVIGTRLLDHRVVEDLGKLRRAAPAMSIVVLTFVYEAGAVRGLRHLSKGRGAGCSYVLKQTVGTAEQLEQIVIATAEGRIIIDPQVLEEMVTLEDLPSSPLNRLTARELEILTWMARGYRNAPIAGLLHLEPKTVERHINNIYGKLGETSQTKHPRVQAIAMFLTTVGRGQQGVTEEWEDAPGGHGPTAVPPRPVPTQRLLPVR